MSDRVPVEGRLPDLPESVRAKAGMQPTLRRYVIRPALLDMRTRVVGTDETCEEVASAVVSFLTPAELLACALPREQIEALDAAALLALEDPTVDERVLADALAALSAALRLVDGEEG